LPSIDTDTFFDVGRVGLGREIVSCNEQHEHGDVFHEFDFEER
jgi:hypothetical protein